MVPVVHYLRPRSLDCPSPSRLGLSLYTRLIPIPQINLRNFYQRSQPVRELLPEQLILPVRPWFRYLQDIPLLMKKAEDCGVGTLKRIFLRDMAIEGRGCPERPLGAARFLKLFDDFFFLFTCNQRSSSCPFLCHKTVGAIGVEGPDNLPYRAVRQLDCLHHLRSRCTDKEHDDDK